jgi:tetraacyldisaccharide 4'-kinase
MRNYLARVIRGEEKGVGAELLKPFLWCLSGLYVAGVLAIRLAYRLWVLRPHALGKPVISIGNITVGGTGKTPFVLYLAERLKFGGQRPVILMRGYMSRSGAVSDEAEMIRRKVPGVPVCVSPDRVKAAAVSSVKDHPDVFILDDGFQHWKVLRDLDIVLIDAMDPFGNGHLLPAGILREPKSQLKRAHLFVITRADLAPDRLASLRVELAAINPKAAIVETAHVPVGLEEPFGKDGGCSIDWTEIKGRMCACSAIGSPKAFAATLEALGADVVHHEVFSDHHVYTADDVRRIVDFCREKGLDRIVTTEKDIVKFAEFKELFNGVRFLVLSINVKILRGDNELSSCLDSVLRS